MNALNVVLYFAGPPSIPLLGSWDFFKVYLKGGKLQDLTSDLGAKYGPIIFFRIALDAPVVVLRTYDVLKVTAARVYWYVI